MGETPLNKLKNKGKECATAVLLQVNLAAEEARLRKCFTELGKKLHGAVKGKTLIDIKDDPSVVEVLGEIEERTRGINALKDQIKNGKK
ncbi:MAG: hypothetical protein MJY87_09885 [Fibrobacter sp.]|nr:hypothetical protein [Fibrobacter sp.]